MAGGGSVELYHCRILCQSISLHLGCKVWGSQSVPKEDTGFSVSEAAFVSPLTNPREFLDGGEIPSPQFLQKIECAVSRFAFPLPPHVAPSPPTPLPPTLLAAQFVFVREEASVPSLAPLYPGPYLVLERRDFVRCSLSASIPAVVCPL